MSSEADGLSYDETDLVRLRFPALAPGLSVALDARVRRGASGGKIAVLLTETLCYS
jgi:hypothetical protein